MTPNSLLKLCVIAIIFIFPEKLTAVKRLAEFSLGPETLLGLGKPIGTTFSVTTNLLCVLVCLRDAHCHSSSKCNVFFLKTF